MSVAMPSGAPTEDDVQVQDVDLERSSRIFPKRIEKKIEKSTSGCVTSMTAVEARMLDNLDDEESRQEIVFDRLLSYWGLIGLVGALFGGFAYAAYIAPNNWPPSDDDGGDDGGSGSDDGSSSGTPRLLGSDDGSDDGGDDGNASDSVAQYVAGFMNGLATSSGLTCAVLSTLLFAFMNSNPKEKAADFVNTHKVLCSLPMLFLGITILSLLPAAITVGYTTYDTPITILVAVFWTSGVAYLFAHAVLVYKNTEDLQQSKEAKTSTDIDKELEIATSSFSVRYVSFTEVHLLQNHKNGDEIHDRLESYYNGIGVVSALIGGLAFSTFTGPPDATTTVENDIVGFFLTLSGLTGILSSLLATVYYALLETVPAERTKEWAISSLRYLGKPLLLLVVCIFSMIIATLLMTNAIYGQVCLSLSIVMYTFAVCVLLCMVRYMHTTTYQKSEEEENLFHVDTPKAQNPSPEEIIANSWAGSKCFCGIISVLTCIECKLVRHSAAGDHLTKEESAHWPETMNETEAMAIVDQRCDTTQEFNSFEEKYSAWFKIDADSEGKVTKAQLLGYIDDFEGSDIQARLSSYWTLLGLVGALFAGISFSTFTGIPDDLAEDAKGYFWFMGLCLSASALAGLGCVTLSTVYFAYLNTVPNKHTLTWVIDFLPILCFPMVCLLGCFGGLGLATLLLAYGIYEVGMLVCGCLAICGGGVIALCLLCYCFWATRDYEETKAVKWVPGKFDFDEDILKHSWASWCIIRLFCSNEVRLLRVVKDPVMLHERLMGYWSLIGFLGAIVGTLAFAVFSVPPKFDGSGTFTAEWFMGAFLAMGFVCGLAATVLSSYYTQLLTTVPDKHTYEWAVKMLPLLCWPTLLFLGCCGATAVGFWIVCLGLYGWGLFGFSTVVCLWAGVTILYVGLRLNCAAEFNKDNRKSVWDSTQEADEDTDTAALVDTPNLTYSCCCCLEPLMRLLCSCECKMLNSVPASELFDRLTTYWTTLSGINAFVAAFSWAAFVSNDGPASITNGTDCYGEDGQCRPLRLGLCLLISGTAGFVGAIVNGIFYQVLNSCSPKPEKVKIWVRNSLPLLWIPLGCLVVCTGLLGIALLQIAEIYSSAIIGSLAGVFLICFVVLLITYCFLHMKVLQKAI